jgi:hypothetical protein
MNIIRKLLLVKEIVSKKGIVHFRRYRLFKVPMLAVYVHHILRSDEDDHLHSHPWSYISFILEGAYKEDYTYPPFNTRVRQQNYYSGDVVYHHATDTHKIKLISDQVWSLVLTWGRPHPWSYNTDKGLVDHKEYRQLKNEGKLPKK